MSTQKAPTVQLYTDMTPNGVKITMALEELGVPYECHTVDISKGSQKEQWFLDVNPNGRIPAMTDTLNGEKVRVLESASILIYLIEQYDPEHKLSYPRGTKDYYEMINWLMFQNAGLGPMQGQSNHFFRYAPERIKYPTDRYLNETRRLYRVLDTHLKNVGFDYIVGNKCTIADVTTIGWVFWSAWSGVDIEEFPVLKQWRDRMMARPAIAKGNDIPHPSKLKDILGDDKKMEEYAQHSRGWILQGMSEHEKKEEKK